MRTELDKTKLLWFMGSLLFVAFIINSFFASLTSPRAAIEPIRVRDLPTVQSAPTVQNAPRPPEPVVSTAPTTAAEQTEPAALRIPQPFVATASKTDDGSFQASRRAAEEEEARRRAAAEAAAQHARFLARYLTPGISRKAGIRTVALMAASEDRTIDYAITAALANKFKSASLEIDASFFTPAFASDGLLNQAFADPNPLVAKLEIRDSLDLLLLARQTVRYSANPGLANVLTANMELEIGAFASDASAPARTWKFTANGAGFKQSDARAMAEERLLRQIGADTKMSLAHQVQTHSP